MKRLFLSATLTLAIAFTAFSQTNPAPATLSIENAKAIAGAAGMPTNINQVMIEILSGTKDAAKEIYGASKEAIHKSIDFVGTQAPDVIQQFLTWRFFKALTWAGFFFFVAGICFFFSYKSMKFQQRSRENSDDHAVGCVFKWIFIIVALAFITFGGGTNTLEMVKIKVAPKVYLIEYVVDLIHGNNTNQRP
jgi:hypothetical protein